MSIRAKLTVAIAASMVALAVASGALVRIAEQRALRIAAEQAIAGAGASFAALERADVEKLDATLRALSADAALVEAFARRDRARLVAAADPVFRVLKQDHDVTHMTFIEPSRKVFLRVHRPEDSGDVTHRTVLTRAIDTLSFGAGKEFAPYDFALRVVRPWYARDGSLAGFVELGEEMDHFVARLKQQTGDEYGLIIEKAFLDRSTWAKGREKAGKRDNWDDRPRSVMVNATASDERELVYDGDMSSVPDPGLVVDEDEHDGKAFVHGIVPVKDAAGRRVGGLVLLHDITALHAAMERANRGIYGVIAALAVVLAIILVSLVNRVVLRRLQRMARELEVLEGRFAVGDLDVRVPRPSGDDEVGRFEAALGAFVARVIALLRDAARGKRSG